MNKQEINWYSFTEDLTVQENEIINYEKAIKILERYINNKDMLDGTVGGSVEDFVSKSLFGFSMNKETFIEINIDTKEEYRIKFESPQKKKIWIISFPSLYQKEYKITQINDLKAIIKSFFEKPIDEFLNYFDNLPYKRLRL